MTTSVCYVSGYRSPKPVAQQVEILRPHFLQKYRPRLHIKTAQVEVPGGAEGVFVIPRWQEFFNRYCDAVQSVMYCAGIHDTTRDYGYTYTTDSDINELYMHEDDRKADFMQRLAEQQGGNVLCVPAQFGARYHDIANSRVQDLLAGNEWGLGAFEVGIMLLTHPERLRSARDLGVSCTGDYWYFRGSDRIPRFDYGWHINEGRRGSKFSPVFGWGSSKTDTGAVTAFSPK